MVLKATTAPATPAFEEEDTTVAAAESPQAPAPAPAAAAPAPEKPQTQVAVRPQTAVAPPKMDPSQMDSLAQFQDRLPAPSFGEGIRLVAAAGEIKDQDKVKYGREIDILLLSWNERFILSPGGDSKDEKARKLTKYSLDKVTTEDGFSVEEYMKELREVHGYKDAAVKTYLDLFGVIQACDKTDAIGTAVAVSLSPDSVKSFQGFRKQVVVDNMLGTPKEQPNLNGFLMRLTVESRSGNGNDWSRFSSSYAV